MLSVLKQEKLAKKKFKQSWKEMEYLMWLLNRKVDYYTTFLDASGDGIVIVNGEKNVIE